MEEVEQHTPPAEPKPRARRGATVEQKVRRENTALIVIFSVMFLVLVAGAITFKFVRDWWVDSGVSEDISHSLENGNGSVFDHASIGTVAESLVPSVVSILTRSAPGASYSGAGTGIIVSSNGYILTNRHVVASGSAFAVVVNGEDMYEDVKLVGVDPLNDVAFLKVNGGNDFRAAEFGDSKSLVLGQEVIAIGNSLGIYPNTVTAGIISGMGRSITASDSTGYGTERLTDMIQTDAAINQGNSGGPLVNAGGQVIGINTAVSTSGQGIGFAIPIGAVKGMLRHVLETGQVERAFLGVHYLELDASVAARYDLEVTRGAYVYSDNADPSVIAGSPAADAGIRDGDIITKVGRVDIGKAGSLGTLLGEYTIGDRVDLTIVRDGETLTKTVTLTAYSE